MKLCHTVAIIVALAWALPAVAQKTKEKTKVNQEATSRVIFRATAAVMTKSHIKKPKIDKALRRQWLKQYLETLDPSKLYFLAEDISEFEKFEDELPDFKAASNLKLFELVWKRHKLRVESALRQALDRIDQAFDFTLQESATLKHQQWPQTKDDRTERWRLQLKYDVLVERSHTSKRRDQIEFLKLRYTSIREQVSQQTRLQAQAVYLDTFCRTVDPHSGYLSDKDFKCFYGHGSWRNVKTIGLSLSPTNGRLMISNVIPKFRHQTNASRVLGCELLAIRSEAGVLYNCREIAPNTIFGLISWGLKRDETVTLELYDESKLQRFAIDWPRKDT